MAAKELTVKTVFKAIDEATAPIRRIERNLAQSSKHMQKQLKKNAKASKAFGFSLKNTLKIAAGFKGIQLGISGLKSAIAEGMSFEKTMSEVSAKMKGVRDEGGKLNEQVFKQLEDSARKVGATTEFSATQAGEGLGFLAKAGYNAEQAMTALPGMVDLATAANLDLARASDIASDTLGAFNLMTEDSAQLQENMARVSDVMAKTSAKSNLGMEELFETMRYAAPAAKALGASIETVSAMTGIMADSGIKASVAGTTMRSMFSNLAAPTGSSAGMIAKLGLKIKDSSGNMRDMFDILGDLEQKTKKMGNAQKAAAIKALFGKQALSGANIILAKGTEGLKKYRAQLEKSQGASKQMAEVMRDNVTGAFAKFKSSVADVSITVFKMLAPVIKSILQGANNAVSAFGDWFRSMEDLGKSKVRKVFKFLIYAAKHVGKAIMTVVKFVRTLATDIIDAANKAGFFRIMVSVFNTLKDVFYGVIDLAKQLWAVFKDTGALDLVIHIFTTFAGVLQTVGKLFLWLKPIVTDVAAFLMIALKPVIAVIKYILKGYEAIATLAREFESDEDRRRKYLLQVQRESEEGLPPSMQGIAAFEGTQKKPELAEGIQAAQTQAVISGGLDVNFNNVPVGTSIKKQGNAVKKMRVNTGNQPALSPVGA